MKIILFVFAIIFSVVFFVSKLMNYSTRIVDAENRILRSNICDSIMNNYSISNAGFVNSILSSKNSPVRSEGISFFDGVMKGLGGCADADLPECKLIDLKDVVIDQTSEGGNGSV